VQRVTRARHQRRDELSANPHLAQGVGHARSRLGDPLRARQPPALAEHVAQRLDLLARRVRLGIRDRVVQVLHVIARIEERIERRDPHEFATVRRRPGTPAARVLAPVPACS
jgi:hypothetical protein